MTYVTEYQHTGRGSLRKNKRLMKWEAVANYRQADPTDLDEDGNLKWSEWKQKTHALDVKCFATSDRNKGKAKQAKDEWFDKLVAKAEATNTRLLGHEKGGMPTLAACIDSHLEKRPKEAHIDLSTQRRNRERADVICEHEVAMKPIDEITKRDIERLRNDLLDEYAPVTVRDLLVLVKAALRRAVDDDLIVKSPAERVTVAVPRNWEPTYLDEENVEKLVESLSNLKGRAKTLTAPATKLALYTGMRQGEICALRFRDIDYKAMVIHVRKSIGRGEKDTYYLKDPKTKTSKRDIPMNPLIVDTIDEAIAMHEAAGEPTKPSDYVFGCGKTFMCPKALYRNFKRRVERAGLESSTEKALTFHSLRHTFATLAIKQGVDVRSVASILGHSDVSVTLNLYAASDTNAKRAAMDAMSRCFTMLPVVTKDETGVTESEDLKKAA